MCQRQLEYKPPAGGRPEGTAGGLYTVTPGVPLSAALGCGPGGTLPSGHAGRYSLEAVTVPAAAAPRWLPGRSGSGRPAGPGRRLDCQAAAESDSDAAAGGGRATVTVTRDAGCSA